MATFDHSRMALIDVRGEERPPFIVLTSQDVLTERPELAPYRVEGQEGFTVWGGNDPAPIYLQFANEEELHRVAGNPRPVDSPGGFDASGFDQSGFDTDGLNLRGPQVESQGFGGAQTEGTTLADATLESSATLGVLPALRPRAATVMASSSWTGNRSRKEQIEVVHALAPLARQGVELLIDAIDEKRFNDLATRDALRDLRELRDVLSELIALAEGGKPLESIWRRLEITKEKVTDAIWNGAQVMVVAPILAVGSATFLSHLSGVPVSDGMVTALCAASMTKDAVMTIAKRR